jgi:hypothetical protein
MGAWLDYFNSIVMGVSSLLFLFEGARRLALHGVRKDAIYFASFGVFISLLVGGMAYFQHRMAVDVIETLKRPVFTKHMPLPDDWRSNCCNSTREVESRRIVQAAFVESGKFYTYLDASGKRLPFVPSEKDIKEREERVISNARMVDAAQDHLSGAVYTLIASALAMLFGAGIGHEQRRASANSTAESDARKSSARGSP